MRTKVLKFLIIFAFIFIILNMNGKNVYASEASVSANNCTLGENFSVTVAIPNDAIGISATLKVTYSDGSVATQNVYSMGFNANTLDTYWPGNYTATFQGKVAGNATVSLNDIVLSDKDARKINSNNTATTSVLISDPTPAEPEPPTTPSENNGGSTTTTNKPETPVNLTFSDGNEKMYTNKRVNMRQNYGTSSIIIQTLPEGVEVTRTGVSSGTANRIFLE